MAPTTAPEASSVIVNPVVIVSVPAMTTAIASAPATRHQRRSARSVRQPTRAGSTRNRSRQVVAQMSSSAASGAE